MKELVLLRQIDLIQNLMLSIGKALGKSLYALNAKNIDITVQMIHVIFLLNIIIIRLGLDLYLHLEMHKMYYQNLKKMVGKLLLVRQWDQINKRMLYVK